MSAGKPLMLQIVYIVAVCLTVFAICVKSADEMRDDTSGKCGASMNWTYDTTTQTLTINGTGQMYNFGSYRANPWDAYKGSIKTVVFEGKVEKIGENAFFECTSLSSITIPDTVTWIEANAFMSCTSLTSITIPASVVRMPETENVFSGCTSLRSIHVDEKNEYFKDVDGVLFDMNGTTLISYPCGRHGDYEILGHVKVIQNNAFESCAHLTSVKFFEGLEKIGLYAFDSCKSLTSVEIPSSVTFIGSSAFRLCTNLVAIEVDRENVNYTSEDGVLYDKTKSSLIQYPSGKKNNSFAIPDFVRSIKTQAFYDVSGLTSVVISSNVVSISPAAFTICNELEVVSYLGKSNPAQAMVVFVGCEKLKAICVPVDYESTSFCEKNNILCKRMDCDRLRDSGNEGNQCFRAICENNEWLIEKRENVTKWEEKSNECIHYECDNNSGVVAENKCKPLTSSGMSVCKDNQCVKEESKPTKEWSVNISIEEEEEELIALNTTWITETICNLIRTNCENIEVEVEMDNSGHLLNVIVYVDDEDTAKVVEAALAACDENKKTCGVFRRVRRIRIDSTNPLVSGSISRGEQTPEGSFFAAVLIVLTAMEISMCV